jgi:hypothetical protein
MTIDQTEPPGGDRPGPPLRPSGTDVALAVARERLTEAYFVNALEFIKFTNGELAPPRALAVYARLHHLTEEQYRSVKNRVLASFGGATSAASTPPPSTFVAINGDVEWDITASLFHRIRRRMGGRRNFRLRKRVELFSGKVEMSLLRIHVDSVARLMALHERDTSVALVLRMYMEELGVRRSLHHAIYFAVLERLHEELESAGELAASENAAVSPVPTPGGEGRTPLKMVPGSARKSG